MLPNPTTVSSHHGLWFNAFSLFENLAKDNLHAFYRDVLRTISGSAYGFRLKSLNYGVSSSRDVLIENQIFKYLPRGKNVPNVSMYVKEADERRVGMNGKIL